MSKAPLRSKCTRVNSVANSASPKSDADRTTEKFFCGGFPAFGAGPGTPKSGRHGRRYPRGFSVNPSGTWFLLWPAYPGLTLRLRSGQTGAIVCAAPRLGEWLLVRASAVQSKSEAADSASVASTESRAGSSARKERGSQDDMATSARGGIPSGGFSVVPPQKPTNEFPLDASPRHFVALPEQVHSPILIGKRT
jgi:hypothetical protein